MNTATIFRPLLICIGIVATIALYGASAALTAAAELPEVPPPVPHEVEPIMKAAATMAAVARLPRLAAPAPLTADSTTTDAPAAQAYRVGNRIETTVNLNVRSYPSLAAETLRGTVVRGERGTVRTSHIAADGYRWQVVSFDSGLRGWVAVAFVAEVDAMHDTPSLTPPAFDAVPTVSPRAVGMASVPMVDVAVPTSLPPTERFSQQHGGSERFTPTPDAVSALPPVPGRAPVVVPQRVS